MPPKLVVVGGGQMGSALVNGLLAAEWAEPSELAVVEPVPERRAALSLEHEGIVVAGAPSAELVGPAGGVLLAVKPDVAEAALRLLGATGARRVLSVVAGMQNQRLEAALPDGVVVIRAMPNSPALVGAGVSVISGGSNAHSADLEWAEEILSAVGAVVRLPERHLDAVTGLSGSGPAYIFVVAEALIEAGVLTGLPRDVSRTLVVETLLGSAKLLTSTGEDPAVLRSRVTSPGGTTAAGLRALESRAVRAAFADAVVAATERSRQLGR
ncbi:MAG TPA: pyrroline-5-carboxylate reductase [Acidimicrobiales bacterium]|nr:pyrroline-5-carboxylate reductase [Acidimicrobiales bacterium]